MKKSKDGYYRLYWTHNGKQYTFTAKSQKKVKEKKEAFVEKTIAAETASTMQMEAGEHPSMTVDEWAEKWLDTYIRPKIAKNPAKPAKNEIQEKSARMYEQKLHGVILPAIGTMLIKDVRSEVLQELLNTQAHQGSAKSSCEKVKWTLDKMFREAFRNKYIASNPAEFLEILADEGEGIRATTPDEDQWIEKVAKTHYAGPWILFLRYSGLRPSESIALWVSDIDFVNKRIHVNAAVKSGTNIIGSPKSSAGTRYVPMLPQVEDILREATNGKSGDDFVFTQTDGISPKTKSSYSNEWRSFKRQMDLAMGAEHTNHGHIYDQADLDKYGVPLYPDSQDPTKPRNGHKVADDLVPYCLRHAFANDLKRSGIPVRDAMYFMGHSDSRMTLEIYQDTQDCDIEAARNALTKLYKKEKS